MIKSLIYSIALLLVLSACQSQSEQGLEKIEAAKLQDLQADGVAVIDIRTPAEFSQGHIAGVLHMNYLQDNFWEKVNQLPKEKPVIVYCASGGRSGKAAREMVSAGFQTVYEYSGGISDWSKKGLPLVK